MVDSAIIRGLHEFGMTERESKLYLAMLEKPEATAAELHRISGVLRTKTYETLAQMVSRGFCHERVEGRHRYFRAVRPAILRDTFQRRWDIERNQKRNSANDIFNKLESLFQKQPKESRSLDFIEVIHSFERICQTFLSLNSQVEFEVLSFNCMPWICHDPEIMKEQEKVILQALTRGVKHKAIYMAESKEWTQLQPSLLRFIEAGEEARLYKELPMMMYIFDRRKAMIAFNSTTVTTKNDFKMAVVEDSGFSRSCMILFYALWDKSLIPEEWQKAYMVKEALSVGAFNT